MVRRDDQVQERYEDALFALLMRDLEAEQIQQAKARQEQMQGEATGKAMDDLDRRCLSMIRKHYAKERARNAGKIFWKVVSRVAVAICLMIACFAVAYATSDSVRINTLNFLIEVREDHTDLRFPGEWKYEDRGPILSVGRVPERYTLTEKCLDHSEVAFEYVDIDGNRLVVSCRSTRGIGVGIDTEDAVVEDVTVQGSKGMLVEKNGEYQLVWPAKNNTRLLSIIAFDLSREEVLTLSEALVYD